MAVCDTNLYSGLVAGMATNDYPTWVTTTTSGSSTNEHYQGMWMDEAAPIEKPKPRLNGEFHRVNRLVQYFEGDKLEEPLDALRIKVAKWLNPK